MLKIILSCSNILQQILIYQFFRLKNKIIFSIYKYKGWIGKWTTIFFGLLTCHFISADCSVFILPVKLRVPVKAIFALLSRFSTGNNVFSRPLFPTFWTFFRPTFVDFLFLWLILKFHEEPINWLWKKGFEIVQGQMFFFTDKGEFRRIKQYFYPMRFNTSQQNEILYHETWLFDDVSICE